MIAYEPLQAKYNILTPSNYTNRNNILSSCHVTCLIAALWDKTLSDDSLSSTFQKRTILGPARLMDYRE